MSEQSKPILPKLVRSDDSSSDDEQPKSQCCSGNAPGASCGPSTLLQNDDGTVREVFGTIFTGFREKNGDPMPPGTLFGSFGPGAATPTSGAPARPKSPTKRSSPKATKGQADNKQAASPPKKPNAKPPSKPENAKDQATGKPEDDGSTMVNHRYLFTLKVDKDGKPIGPPGHQPVTVKQSTGNSPPPYSFCCRLTRSWSSPVGRQSEGPPGAASSSARSSTSTLRTSSR